jgi:two-component system sensor histidine kinase MtrB
VIRRVGAIAGAVRHRWRRSLQTRVIATTLLLSGTVSVLIGATILHQVRSGLLDSATRSALGQLSAGVGRAQQQFEAQPRGNAHADDAITSLGVVKELSPGPEQDSIATRRVRSAERGMELRSDH